MPLGFQGSSASLAVQGNISAYTLRARKRRRMRCEVWLPKSNTKMVCNESNQSSTCVARRKTGMWAVGTTGVGQKDWNLGIYTRRNGCEAPRHRYRWPSCLIAAAQGWTLDWLIEGWKILGDPSIFHIKDLLSYLILSLKNPLDTPSMYWPCRCGVCRVTCAKLSTIHHLIQI